MRIIVKIIATLSLLVIELGAVEVVYEGTSPHDTKDINRIINQASPNPDSVTTLLRNDGYLDACVHLEKNQLTIAVGQLYIIDSVYIASDSSFIIHSGNVFNKKSLQELTDSILTQYYDRGYYWASARVIRVHKHKGTVNLELRIRKGPMVKLGNTVYTGLVRTSSDLVARYITVGAGDTLSDATRHRAEEGAAAIPFITFHPPVEIRPHEGYTTADLAFQFSEKRQFGLEIGGGYLPDNATGLVWHLDLNFDNLFGRGRQASIFSERRERGRNALRVSYGQPLFLVGVGRLRLEVATRDYRKQFYEFSLQGAYITRLKGDISGGLSLGWKTVQPSVSLPAYSCFTTQFSIERQALDNKANPANGLSLMWSISYSYRRYAEDSLAVAPERWSFNETRTAVYLKWYKRVAGLLVGHLGLNYVGLETNESLPPISELIFVGGPGTIRGFRNEQFTALRAAFGTIEPRLRFSNAYLFAFYDAAYLNNRISGAADPLVPEKRISTQERYRYGYGVGLAFHDAHRSVKLSLGWNPELAFDQPRLSVEFSSDI